MFVFHNGGLDGGECNAGFRPRIDRCAIQQVVRTLAPLEDRGEHGQRRSGWQPAEPRRVRGATFENASFHTIPRSRAIVIAWIMLAAPTFLRALSVWNLV